MSCSPRSHVRRRRLGVLACLVWLLGVELLPDLHLALHEQVGVHHHDGDAPLTTAGGLTVTVHRDTVHVHAGGPHQHGAEVIAAAAPAPAAVTDTAPAPREHGRHSLAHRALAWAAPSPILMHPLPVDHRPRAVTHVIAQRVAIAPPPDAAARAPPT